MIFHCTQSLIWWYRMSICLDLQWNTGLTESLMQPWLSQFITVGSKCELNNPTRIFLIHIASHAVKLATIFSAYAELSATDLCFLLYQETTIDPILKIPPDVLFLSVGLLAQSLSVKPHSFTSSNYLYHNPYPDVPLRYLNTCLPTFQKRLVGLTIACESWLTA